MFCRSPCSSMYSTMCFTSAGTSWPLTVCARVTSARGTPKTRVVLAEPPHSLPGNGDTLFLMSSSSSSPQPRQDLTSADATPKWLIYLHRYDSALIILVVQFMSSCFVQPSTKSSLINLSPIPSLIASSPIITPSRPVVTAETRIWRHNSEVFTFSTSGWLLTL